VPDLKHAHDSGPGRSIEASCGKVRQSDEPRVVINTGWDNRGYQKDDDDLVVNRQIDEVPVIINIDWENDSYPNDDGDNEQRGETPLETNNGCDNRGYHDDDCDVVKIVGSRQNDGLPVIINIDWGNGAHPDEDNDVDNKRKGETPPEIGTGCDNRAYQKDVSEEGDIDNKRRGEVLVIAINSCDENRADQDDDGDVDDRSNGGTVTDINTGSKHRGNQVDEDDDDELYCETVVRMPTQVFNRHNNDSHGVYCGEDDSDNEYTSDDYDTEYDDDNDSNDDYYTEDEDEYYKCRDDDYG
jgi:hypothetical protein